MKRWQLVIGLLVAVAALAAAAPVFAAQTAQTAAPRAAFGTVVDAAPGAGGAVTLRLDDGGARTIVNVPATASVRISGIGEAAPGEIKPDDRVAAAIRQEANGSLTATSVAVVRTGVEDSRHLTGVVATVAGTVAGVIASDGTHLTVDVPPSAGAVAAGDVVTMVVTQDARTGLLRAVSMVTPDQALVRVQEAIQAAKDNKRDDQARNMQVLLERLVANHLGLLRQNLDRVPERDRGALSQALQTRTQAYRSALVPFNLQPTVIFTGVITAVGAGGSSISVTAPEGGQAAAVQITAQSTVAMDGRPATRADLAVGQAVTVVFDAQILNATSVQIGRQTLSSGQVTALRSQVLRGELEGTITAVNPTSTPARVTVTPATGNVATIEVGGATRIEVDGQTAAVAILPVGRKVYVSYNTSTNVASTILVLPDASGQTNVSGIVVGLNRKGRTLVLSTQTGQSVDLSLPENLAITRNGQKVSIAEVRLGDLVRPSTRYTIDTRTLTRLDLKAPATEEITGTVAGAMETRSGIQTVTVAMRSAGTVTLTVVPSSSIRRNDQAVSFAAVRPGDKVLAAEFNPGNMELVRLVIESSAGQSSGAVTAVNSGGLRVTIRRDDGTDVELREQKPYALERNGVSVDSSGIAVGDLVLSVQYDAATGQPIRMILAEPGVATAAGVISAIDTSSRTVEVTLTSSGAVLSARLAAATVVQRNGRPAALADLQRGDRVVVYYVKDTREARSVSATAAPSAASAPAEVHLTGRVTAKSGDTVTVGTTLLLITKDTKVTGELAVGARVSAVARAVTAGGDVLVAASIEVIVQ